LLNAPTIVLTIGAGQVASRSIGAGPAVHTVAGVGVWAEPRDRERVVAEPGLVWLILVVVEAVGQGRRSPPRRVPVGRVESPRRFGPCGRTWRAGRLGGVMDASQSPGMRRAVRGAL
jgi:hypothetical protein